MRRRSDQSATTRPTSTRTATARTWPARSARRSTASASPASRRSVDLVNLRAGQDSGYFFLEPTVDALTYAGDIGIDVVNMSFYIDPWLFNCARNPADSPARAGASSARSSTATQRAVNFARTPRRDADRGRGQRVTPTSANPTFDDTSPDYPAGRGARAHDRQRLPEHADRGAARLDVSSVGPVNPASSPYPRKAFYSNYGVEQTVVAAPGGDSREFFGTPQYNAPENRILAAYPLNVAQACGEVDANGLPNGATLCDANTPGTSVPRSVPLVRNCANGVCALYQWIQGTSMASPHAVGVAALIVSQRGERDRARGGLTMDPDKVEKVLRRTATDTPCPAQEPFVYPSNPGAFDATCVGTPAFNGFYGDGVVNALAASKSGGGRPPLGRTSAAHGPPAPRRRSCPRRRARQLRTNRDDP